MRTCSVALESNAHHLALYNIETISSKESVNSQELEATPQKKKEHIILRVRWARRSNDPILRVIDMPLGVFLE